MTRLLASGLLVAGLGCQPRLADRGDPTAIVWPEPGDTAPLWLSQLGIYHDIDRHLMNADLRPFTPAFALWSDGTDKRRWIGVPPGERIDTTDFDHWRFPVGTIVVKEFSHAGRRLETRLSVRTGPGPRDVWMGAFVWNDDESDALFVPDGANDLHGTDHDAPPATQCSACHGGEPSRVLGFSAVQQPVLEPELLSAPPRRPISVLPDPTAAAALGYLHANCGHCHNPNGSARPDTDMNLRLAVDDLEVDATHVHRTTIGVPMQRGTETGARLRLQPGIPEQSGLWLRMTQPSPPLRMPPIASTRVDDHGVAIVRAWIESMSTTHAEARRVL